MKHMHRAAVALIALLIWTLAPGDVGATARPASDRPLPVSLATLLPVGNGKTEGSVRIKGFPTSRNGLMRVQASHLPAKSRQAWQIRAGTCAALGAVIYDSGPTKALQANKAGQARAEAMVAGTAMLFGFHAVTIGSLACGELVVAGGLDNPRGLAFGPNRKLYIAEAGRGGAGPCHSGEEITCYGATGAITTVKGGRQRRIASTLPSATQPDGSNAHGPHGISFLGSTGYVAVGGAAASLGPSFGHLLKLQLYGRQQTLTDLRAFENKRNPDGGAVDSNPFGVAAGPQGVAVVDAGSNSLLLVSPKGEITLLAVFPTRLAQPPPYLGGGPIAMQAVPTAVVRGPDGAWYVGQLTGYPYPPGGAAIYRVPAAGGTPTVYKSGFSTIIGLAFGPNGSLYVAEFASQGLLDDDFVGAIKRIGPRAGTVSTTVSTGLLRPGGVAVGPDGHLYVTTMSHLARAGRVLRFTAPPA